MTLLTIVLFVCTGDEMSRMITRKGKIQTSGMQVPTSIPDSYNISDTNNHDGMEHYLSYVEILDMFENERFPSDDPDIDTYRNIQKSGIHTVVTHPELFPYNDAARWCFMYLQKDTGLIVNASGPSNHLTQRR
jgi:hypothetical protein